jgi:hypothetical protein
MNASALLRRFGVYSTRPASCERTIRQRTKQRYRRQLTHYKQQILACDFFTVETLWLQTLAGTFPLLVEELPSQPVGPVLGWLLKEQAPLPSQY